MTGAAPRVEIRLPSILKVMVGRTHVRVSASTVSGALDAAYAVLPGLRGHLELETGGLRPHILCLLNEERVPRDALAKTPLREGDEIWIVQAITGG